MAERTLTDQRPGVEIESDAAAEPSPRRSSGAGRSRLAVRKTYKLYVAGAFPRSESGRYDPALAPGGEVLANVCRASRKDVRDAVVAARAAQPGWAARTAYNRGQILYRMAELLEGRAAQLEQELESMGSAAPEASVEVAAAVDRLVYYAGWCDKVQQVFSSVNPVASSHFVFSMLEPMGVVAILAPEESPLLGLVSVVAPVIAGGNTCVALASCSRPLAAVTLAEVMHASDLPGGVVNVLTGRRDELRETMASHMDVDAILVCAGEGGEIDDAAGIERQAVHNLKRLRVERRIEWLDATAENPYAILDFQETKTTWHPVGF
ncbi:MAG TPA: aldehyde dehydrogenase family protein [Thermoanaerobaculia bacterium]|nr:aldehyde dehydrogenase family protein [Thermoanaerobaculia bacterium]